MAFIYEFLKDDNDDLILDENGDKIIIGVDLLGTATAARRVGRKPRAGFIKSFDIIYKSSDATWHLTVNKTEYVGRYHDRDDAVSVLFAMSTACSGRDAMFDVVFDAQLERGVSFIADLP